MARKNIKERLELIRDLKRFAVDELGIPKNPSFEERTHSKGLHVVYASRKDRLQLPPPQWEFGRSGTIQFEQKKYCLGAKRELDTAGFDTNYVYWEAYGSKNCPIFDSLLTCRKTRVAYVVLHEQFHIHAKMRGLSFKLNIEEAIADCFADAAALLFFGSDSSVIRKMNKNAEEWKKLVKFVNDYTLRLNQAYARDFDEGRALLKESREVAVEQSICTARFSPQINNAFFLRQGYYASMDEPVQHVLADLHPGDYIKDRKLLLARLKGLR